MRSSKRSLLGANVTHGLASTYKVYGCRCGPCTRANTTYQAKQVKVREQRLLAGEVHPPHGDTSTYCNYRCRCEPCREAWSEHMRLTNLARRLQAEAKV